MSSAREVDTARSIRATAASGSTGTLPHPSSDIVSKPWFWGAVCSIVTSLNLPTPADKAGSTERVE